VRRLRLGEWIAGASALALFGVMFLHWFGLEHGANFIVLFGSLPESGNAWHALGWAALALCVLAVAAGLVLPVLAARMASPVLPVLAAIVAMLTGFAAVVALLVQVVAQPGPDEVTGVLAGWWLGLAAATGVCVGGALAVHDDHTPNADQPAVEVRPMPPVSPVA
jgi:hypothetical protein